MHEHVCAWLDGMSYTYGGAGVRLVEAVQGIRTVLSFIVKASICVKRHSFHRYSTSDELLNLGLCHIFKIKL